VKQSHKTLLLWVVLIFMFLAIWQFLGNTEKKMFFFFMRQLQAGAARR
jgi:cell division protease FtsH